MNEIDKLLNNSVEEIIVREHLERVLKSGSKLRVKLGIDPTSSDLHLGHLVVLRKLKQFQDMGHKIVFIIGDFTAMIGDPSGRSETRKPLTESQVRSNFKTYVQQASKILNVKKIEIRRNSEWHEKGGLKKILEITSKASIQQILRRADFKERMDGDQDITMLELLYPLFQGYDSVEVKSDLEVGGTDQKFNLLMGRRLQRLYGQSEQDIMTLPLLVGTDGVRKMSKSFDNFIALRDKPDIIFAKVMSVPDTLIKNYFEILTDLEYQEVLPPYESKQSLAFEIVKMLYGEKLAGKAKDNFHSVFSQKEVPKNMPTIGIDGEEIAIVELLLLSGIKSKGEARRLIKQKAIDLDGRLIENPEELVVTSPPVVLKVGKKRFFRVTQI